MVLRSRIVLLAAEGIGNSEISRNLACGRVTVVRWRGSFPSLIDLDDQVRRFINYYNAHEAHPYRWTYTGQPRAV